MARSGTGTHSLHSTATVNDGGATSPLVSAYSMHCWVRSSVAPNAGSFRVAMNHMGDASGSSQSPQNSLYWDHTGVPHSAVHRRANDSYDIASTTTTPSADTWYAFGQSDDGSNLRAWLNGVNEATATSAISANKPVWLSILNELLSNGATVQSQFSNGEVAECAFWRAALTADEFNALAKGFSPRRIRPQSLVSYMPLVRITQDFKGIAWTEVNSPTVTDHPRVFG